MTGGFCGFSAGCYGVILATTDGADPEKLHGQLAVSSLEGTDDQCGGTPASAIGMAYMKADGTVGVRLTLVFSSAVSLHVDGTIIADP